MFSSFIAQKRTIQLQKQHQILSNQRDWKRRYHTEIQPRLLEHYSKRLVSFMRKVAEHPIILNPENLQKKQSSPPAHFTFKNVEDWKSMLTLRERREKAENQRIMIKKYGTIFLEDKSKAKQDPLSTRKGHEYRSRQLQKEIHPAMRYNNKILQKIETPSFKQKRFSLKQSKKKKAETVGVPTLQHLRTTTVSSISNRQTNQQADEAEFNLSKYTRVENIETEARKYEKDRQFIEKKQHFKKLVNLSLVAPKQSDKEQIRQILRKCGYVKNKKFAAYIAPEETDKFASIVEKIGK